MKWILLLLAAWLTPILINFIIRTWEHRTGRDIVKYKLNIDEDEEAT